MGNLARRRVLQSRSSTTRRFANGFGAIILAATVHCYGRGDDHASSGAVSGAPDASNAPANQDPSSNDLPSRGGTGGAAPSAWSFRTTVLTREHRAVPGAMFGGWGPHLGHMVRVQADLYWVDDACAPGTCDVNVDARVDYWKIDGDRVDRVATVALPGGVQQNTGTIASDGSIFTYGIAVTGHSLVECVYAPPKPLPEGGEAGAPACNALALDIGDAANYLGAAIHPSGARVAWLTNVGDGGGGSFRYFVDYGGGWNGPRTGSVGGYNDASYINAGFLDRTSPGRFLLFAELVSGVAPNWSYIGGLGQGSLATASPIAWSIPASLPMDPTISTADLFVDPEFGDTHVLARARSGALVYLYRDKVGAWSAPSVAHPNSYRARFAAANGRLFVVHDDTKKGGLFTREVRRGAGAIDWSTGEDVSVPLPAGYETIYAIYVEADVYQTAKVAGVDVAIVGKARENEVLGVFATPP
jgi:hypothetical protein